MDAKTLTPAEALAAGNTLPEVRWLGRIEYRAALELQNLLVDDLIAGRDGEKILLLEHLPVYTIGRTRDQSSLRHPDQLPHPVFETNRGGQATWHGPGQLVAYPILNLQERGKDLHRYIRFLEEIIILTSRELGIDAGRREGLTGVWVENRKLASIGVGVRRWVSMHGLALNVRRESLEAFQHITPCGISNVTMTSLETESTRTLETPAVGARLAELFLENLSRI